MAGVTISPCRFPISLAMGEIFIRCLGQTRGLLLRRVFLFCMLLITALRGAYGRDLANFDVGVMQHGLGLPRAQEQGMLWIKDRRLDWNWNSLSKANYDSIELFTARGIRPLIVLGYGNPPYQNGGRPTTKESREAFVRYAQGSVKVLKKTHLYEVWNEWDVIGMGGCPIEEGHGRVEDYVSLLKETYPAIKKADSNAVVLGGAVAGIGDRRDYLPKALKLGLLDSLDGLVIHPYFYGASDRSERLPEKGLTVRLNKVKGWLSEYPKGSSVPIYVTELGWPTCDFGDGVTQEVQAKFMARSILLLAEDPQIKGVWIYELRDGGTDPNDKECHFGIIKNDGTPKPAFWVMKDLKKVLDESKSIERMPVKASDSLVMMRLPGKEGEMRWLCWTIQPDTRWKLRITGVGKDGSAKVSPLGRFGFPYGWRDEKEGAEIEIGDLPVCIESSSPNLVMKTVGPVSSGSPAPIPAARVSKPSSAESEILPSY